jgi:hypothetical protein
MWSYTFRRILATIPTLLAVVTVCYLLLHGTPGGPFDDERKVSAAVLANLQAKYHLDLPLWQQYLYYLNSLLHGDLGASFRYADWSVNELVAKALPVSAAIGGSAIVISLSSSGCSSACGRPAPEQRGRLSRDAARQRRACVSFVRDRPGVDPGVRRLAEGGAGRGLGRLFAALHGPAHAVADLHQRGHHRRASCAAA